MSKDYEDDEGALFDESFCVECGAKDFPLSRIPGLCLDCAHDILAVDTTDR